MPPVAYPNAPLERTPAATTREPDMTSIDFSDAEKLAEIRRQLALWRKTYPRAIRQGLLSPHAAAFQLRLWEAIEADYAARIKSTFVAA